ncbi:MAG: A/G-specific adenine glycosylase [Opitutales bacterium]
MLDAKQIPKFRTALLDWYATVQRPLPWRREPSVYRTVVSEFMAQQTQIKTMLPYFERWIGRFPDFETLAEAPEAEVLKHWEGLGYYSRARNLHKLAKAYTAAASKPSTREEWKVLPGIGPYTSAAIASICFHEPIAVIDGNVVRVLVRLTHNTQTFKNNGVAVKAFTGPANTLVPQINPGDHNQAMMELGATVCLKRKPLCALCPVREFCKSYASSEVETIPRILRKATEQLEVPRAWIINNGALLLHRIPDSAGQLAGQYELPKVEDLKLKVPGHQPLSTKTRSITHRRIKEPIYKLAWPGRPLRDHEWIPLQHLEGVTLSGPHRRWIGELLPKIDYT